MPNTAAIDIALPVPMRQSFSYLLAEDMAVPKAGCRVLVPFGQRKLVGFTTGQPASQDVDPSKLKSVVCQIEHQPLHSPALLKMLNWASHYYLHPLGDVFHQAIPTLLRKGEPASQTQQSRWQLTTSGETIDLQSLNRAKKQQQLLLWLRENMAANNAQLKEAGFTMAIIKALAEKQLIEEKFEELLPPGDWNDSNICTEDKLSLNKEQAIAVAAINQQRHYAIHLLLGITGSGKTEVYLTALEHVIQQGQQALILVPEIGLTPQTVARFERRFQVPVVMLHSGLNERERLNAWLQAKDGQAAIVIGTRSAIFTPLKHPGMIILDEEHDSSFKQQDGFRYNARDLAVVRAKLENIPLILGTATPSLETLHNARQGRYQLLELTQRPGSAKQASHCILDIKSAPLTSGLSPQLIKLTQQHLDAGNQVMMFLNRRGYAPALLCHECGWLGHCQRCDNHYTVHQQSRYLQCHHCGAQHPIPRQCHQCGSTQLTTAGVGTEQLEETLNELFPNHPSVRIDRDSTRRKGQLAESLQGIRDNKYSLLIGTQMLAKGHHFPNVTLVALLDVDGALFSADFRAAERLAQLYLQVAGRAGRASKPGQVVLQTHHPEHPLLQELTNNGYQQFADTALQERQLAQLPPYWFMALLRVESHQGEHIDALLARIHQWCSELITSELPVRLIGPMPAPMERRAGRYRWQLLFEASQRSHLHKLLAALLPAIEKSREGRAVRWSVDIDPQDML